jgi:hypothetical protein
MDLGIPCTGENGTDFSLVDDSWRQAQNILSMNIVNIAMLYTASMCILVVTVQKWRIPMLALYLPAP